MRTLLVGLGAFLAWRALRGSRQVPADGYGGDYGGDYGGEDVPPPGVVAHVPIPAAPFVPPMVNKAVINSAARPPVVKSAPPPATTTDTVDDPGEAHPATPAPPPFPSSSDGPVPRGGATKASAPPPVEFKGVYSGGRWTNAI